MIAALAFGRPTALITALVVTVIVAGACSVALPTPAPTPTTGPSAATPNVPPTATPSATPEPIGDWLPAGSNVSTPFSTTDGGGVCASPLQVGCRESSADDSIRITFTVPDGWASGFGGTAVTKAATGTVAPSGMSLHFLRGGWLFSQPCRTVDGPPDLEVGPTADDFADALAAHPRLDTTTPVAVKLGGFSGKYLDLQMPSDISGCTFDYFPWGPAFYAQGPNHRWHIWSLDVDGVRVVIQSGDFAGTLPEDLAEMHAIIDSIQIQP